MNAVTRHCPRIVAALSALIVLAVIATPASAAKLNPGVVPPTAQFMGKSYSEWHAAWWQWAFSIPADQSPFLDPTGANCTIGQSGHVWFLAGTFTTTSQEGEILGEAHRSCTIPAGTALLIPLINGEASEAEGNGNTADELAKVAADQIANVSDLKATIDGQSLTDLNSYRATSSGFTWGPLPINNILGLQEGTSSLAVADGYMILVTPLSVGTHTITFGGQVQISSELVFIQNISYTITVVPGHA